jgi:hypothetical protein
MRNLTVLHSKINAVLEGQPEFAITAGLILVSILALLIAAYGTPAMKAGALLWLIAP